MGQGFDKCEIASIAQLAQWIVQSPYSAVNLYIGGGARACSNRALSSEFLALLSQLGWRFIPTWVGPQAPCNSAVALRMSPDPATARAQGENEANAASDIAAGLGLAGENGSGTILYYDMEYYDTTNAACHTAVKAFITGWTAQIHARGSLAGVYATGSPLSSFAALSNVPDAIWPASGFSAPQFSATVGRLQALERPLERSPADPAVYRGPYGDLGRRLAEHRLQRDRWDRREHRTPGLPCPLAPHARERFPPTVIVAPAGWCALPHRSRAYILRDLVWSKKGTM
jgi:hypothetical protein